MLLVYRFQFSNLEPRLLSCFFFLLYSDELWLD